MSPQELYDTMKYKSMWKQKSLFFVAIAIAVTTTSDDWDKRPNNETMHPPSVSLMCKIINKLPRGMLQKYNLCYIIIYVLLSSFARFFVFELFFVVFVIFVVAHIILTVLPFCLQTKCVRACTYVYYLPECSQVKQKRTPKVYSYSKPTNM